MKKKGVVSIMIAVFVFSIMIVVFVFSIFYIVGICPIIIDNEKTYMPITNNKVEPVKNDIINPIINLNMDRGAEVYLYTTRYDQTELPKGIPKRKVLFTNNISLIKELQNNFTFIYTGGDMATCESVICIRIDGITVYKANIVISDHIAGIQSQYSGWIESTKYKKIINIFKKFRPVYTPIVYF